MKNAVLLIQHSLWLSADEVHVPTKELPVQDISVVTVTPPPPIINSEPSVEESLEFAEKPLESNPSPAGEVSVGDTTSSWLPSDKNSFFGSSDLQTDYIVNFVGKWLDGDRRRRRSVDETSNKNAITRYKASPLISVQRIVKRDLSKINEKRINMSISSIFHYILI